jgi:hypothetical protein
MRFSAEIVDARASGRWIAGALFFCLAWLSIGVPAAASAAVPYHDPSADGYLGLCDAQGHQITSGSIDTTPFAWRAVSSTPAQGLYAGPTRTAVLMAYQPIDGLASSDWSGDQLTASSRYSNTANPMAAATGGDESLAGFMTEYSPKWDGILQLRMYLGASNEAVYSLHYPALDIQVTGKTWHALDGGQVNCKSGTAESIESVLLPASKLKGHPGASASPRSATPNAGETTQSANHTAAWAALAALLVALGLVLFFVVRSRGRRTRAGSAPTAAVSDPNLGENADRVPVTSQKGSTP